MAWYEKEKPTSLDNQDIWGLSFIVGDILAFFYRGRAQEWLKGQKFPVVEFPSGEEFEIWEGGRSPIIHIYGEMDLAYFDTRDEAYKIADQIAQACGYTSRKVGDHQIEVWGHDSDEHYLIEYDNDLGRMVDIRKIEDNTEHPPLPSHILMPDELLAVMPKLRETEGQGNNIMIQVRYFTPTSNWVWYGIEFDPETGIFFGLVDGLEAELGYFSLQDLQEVSKQLTLPIERDLHFEPKTLREIQAQIKKRWD